MITIMNLSIIKNSLITNQTLNTQVINNFKKLRISVFFPPLFLMILIVVVLIIENDFSVDAYILIQKDLFLYINSILSKLPNLQYNLTQLGDVITFLPFVAIFMIYAPKLWESILASLIVSCIFTNVLKRFFAVPRPAAIFDNDIFVITGKAIISHNSLPSGHSIATFTILTSVLFAFMPKKLKFKIMWFSIILSIGALIAFTRVAIGAHYPLDVVIGGIIGYISALIGIFFSRKFNLLSWLTNKKYYFISMILFSIWAIALINKIITINLIVFYFSLACLLTTLYVTSIIYVKKQY